MLYVFLIYGLELLLTEQNINKCTWKSKKKTKGEETFELPLLIFSGSLRTMIMTKTIQLSKRRNRLSNHMRRQSKKLLLRNIREILWSMAPSIFKSLITSNLRTSSFFLTFQSRSNAQQYIFQIFVPAKLSVLDCTPILSHKLCHDPSLADEHQRQ